MSLLDAPTALAWVGKFPAADQSAARMLLESLSLVSPADFQFQLRRLIEGCTAAATAANPAADPAPVPIYVAREMGEGESYFANKRNSLLAATGREIGSEGELARVARGTNRLDGSRYLNHPPIQTILKKRCKDIIILDDMSLSGNRVADFLAAFRRHPTVASWWSYRWIRFHVVAYAITEEAEGRVRRSLRPRRMPLRSVGVTFTFHHRPRSIDQVWPRPQLDEIISFCERYGKSVGHRSEPLGYKDSLAGLVFPHKCPNNTPGVLWQPSASYPPLFPDGEVPTDLLPYFGDPAIAAKDMRDRLTEIGAEDVAKGKAFDVATASGRAIFLVLSGLKKGIRRPDRLGQMTGLPVPGCEGLIQQCAEMGLVDTDGRITPAGLRELSDAAKADRLPLEPPPLTRAFYYPQSLRAAR